MTDPNPTVTIKGRNNSGRAFKEARGDLDKLKSAAKGVGLALGAVAAGGLALMKQTIETTKQTVAYSNALGVSTEALTQFQYAAESVGIGADKVGDIMKDTAEKIGDAFRNNAGEAKEALESMGLSVERLARLSPDQQLFAIAQGLDAVGTQGEKVQILEAIANDASLLLPLLDDGAKGLREMATRADELGVTLTRVEAEKIMQAEESIRELSGSWTGFSQMLTADFAPAISAALNALAYGVPVAVDAAGNAIDWLYNLINPSDIGGHIDEMDKLVERRANLMRQLDDARAMQLTDMTARLESDLDKTELQISALEQRARILADNKKRRELTIEITDGNEADDARDAAMRDRLEKEYAFEDAKTAAVRSGVIARLKFSTWGAEQQTKHVVGEAIRLTRGVAKENRTMFEINKAAGIANAIINTHQGVTQSLKAYPWPLAGAMAALHLAAGLSEISAIRSASFGGGGGAPSSAGSGGTPSNPVPLAPPGDFGGPPVAENVRGQATIIIEGNVYSNDDFRQALVDALNEANELDELQDVRIISNG